MAVVLPPELEREIFEFAGLSSPGFVPTLMLVSREVCQWMEPHLYHIMIFTLPQAPFLLTALRTKPPSFISSNVRKLFLTDGPETNVSLADMQTILSACTGTTELFLAARGRALLPLIGGMPLQRLSANIPSLFTGSVDFKHPLFSNLTHLCVFPLMRDDATPWVELRRVRHLTHLSFHVVKMVEVLREILERCPNLRVLVNFYFSTSTVGAQRTADSELAQDVRYVRMKRGFYAKDWKVGAYTGQDYWGRAEEWVAKRTLGKVHQLEYVVPDE